MSVAIAGLQDVFGFRFGNGEQEGLIFLIPFPIIYLTSRHVRLT